MVLGTALVGGTCPVEGAVLCLVEGVRMGRVEGAVLCPVKGVRVDHRVEGAVQDSDGVLVHPSHEAQVHRTCEEREGVDGKVLASSVSPSSLLC